MTMTTRNRLAGTILALAFCAMLPNTGTAAEIKVIASNAVKEAYADLVPAFETTTGHKVTTVWGGTLDITRRVSAGEVFDIVVIPASGIDTLIRDGRLAAGSRIDFAKSGIGVARHPSTPKPDVSSGDALKASLVSARSIVLSSGPSSFYLLDLFKKWGIADTLAPKIKRLASGLSVGESLAKHEGDIGFTQISEFLAIKGIDYVGPLPADVQHLTVFAMGVHAAAPAAAPARQLIGFLTSPEAAKALHHSGMEPGWVK
jgi:molybdate transport system substrate-binding protein